MSEAISRQMTHPIGIDLRGVRGVYRIVCLTTRRFYVGSSTNMMARLQRHRRDLRSGEHHCQFLQRVWSRYGESNFVVEIDRHEGDARALLEIEQGWLDQHAGTGRLLNVCYVAGTCAGVAQSDATKQKRAEALRGSKRTDEQRRRISSARKSVGITKDHQARLSAIAAQRRFRLSDAEAAEAREMRLRGDTLDAIAAHFGRAVKPLRREMLRHFPDLAGIRTYTRPAILGPKREPTPRSRPDKPWLAERNKARVWTDEMRRKVSDARKRHAAKLKEGAHV
jgi:group I intron endonuclease